MKILFQSPWKYNNRKKHNTTEEDIISPETVPITVEQSKKHQ